MFGKKNKNEIAIKINELPSSTEINTLDIVEIKDKNIISKVKSAIPDIAQIVLNIGATAEGMQLANSGIYQALLPSGAKLVNSTEIEGTVRGFFRQGNKIGGQANLLPVDGTVSKIAAVNMANVAMGAASLIVGQYYMCQINTELININKSLSKIADFQQNEYKSRVMTLCTQLKRASDFQTEVLEDDGLRKEEILRLQNMETICMELLGQANITIIHNTSSASADFKSYIQKVKEIDMWKNYQKVLINILYMIGDLNYTLHLGASSKEQCYSAYKTLYNQSNCTIEHVKRWHKQCEKKLRINVDQARRGRIGIDAIIRKPLEIINKDWGYCSIGKQEVEYIRCQKGMKIINMALDTRDLYSEDVNIIIKDGKIYYMPA